MSHFRTTLLALALALAVAPAACTPPMSPEMAIAELRNPEAKMRAGAADRLRTDKGVPPEAIQPLIEAAAKEQDPAAKGAMMITLGRSGKPEVKDLVEQYVQNAHGPDERRWAARALKYWMIEVGSLAPNESLPDGWPYGTQGYPPIEKE